MFGLGDEAPAPDTVGLMEDILVEYLHETVCRTGSVMRQQLSAFGTDQCGWPRGR
jgi:hypothetical protein